jgi:hypothetical protein
VRSVRRARTLVAVLCCVGCVACGTTTPDRSAYREQAELAVGTALSEVRTVELLLRAEHDEKVLGGYRTTVLRSSGDSLDRTRRTFAGLLPPPGEDRTAGRITALLEKAGQQVGAASLAVHRADRASYGQLVRGLDRTATALSRLGSELR